MLEIREVKSKKEKHEFVDFPNKLYKGNEFYVPPLYSDEMKLFTKKNDYYETCDQVYYNAYKDGKMVGRISGIIQKQYNEIHNEKRARFTRFESIDDSEVAKALLDTVEKWAIDKGMDTCCGPLGFSDMEREGLLIEGFDQMATFEEIYNFPYYQRLIEENGYTKEVDWVASKLYLDEEKYEKVKRLSEVVLKRYHLHLADHESMSKSQFLKTYGDTFFYILDECYKHLYGTVPSTEKVKKSLINQFKMIINPKYLPIILDENNKGVAFGLCFPGFGAALQKSGGRLTPIALVKLLKLVNKPKVIDLGLIGVLPEYQNMAYVSVILKMAMDAMKYEGVDHLETNGNLETNTKILDCWKYFKQVQNKRRRSFVKKIVKED